MAEADRYPPCPECDALPHVDESLKEHYDDFLYTRDEGELAGFPVVSTSCRHRISVDDVLAEYGLREDTRCSMLPRGHPHREGYVVRTRCGLTLKLGKDCGRQLIAEFSRVERTAKRAREYKVFVPQTRERLQALRAKVADAKALEQRLRGFRELLGADARLLAQEMQNAYRVRFDAREAERIPGIELWDYEQPDVARLASKLRQLELDAKGWEERHPGHTEQREYLARVRDVEERVDGFLSWARVAAVLLTREGMEVACRVLDSTPEDVWVQAFDAGAGRLVSRREQVLKRTRDRFVVTDAGVEVLGRLTAIVW